MYATYITDAIVCGSRERGGADRSFLLFTKDAGMLWADARSVREERSKQRYALQEFSLVRVSLVRGKGGWRVGSVEALGNPFSKTASRQARGVVVKLVRLLRRYIHGEEPHPETFRLTAEALQQVAGGAIAERDTFELIFELQLLYLLGYVAKDEAIAPLLALAAADFDHPLDRRERQRIERLIETAASASQL